MVSVADARVVLTQPEVIEMLGGEETVATLGVPLITIADLQADGDEAAWTAPDIDEGAVATLMFTSGSTGDPKGVTLSNGNVLAVCAAAKDILGDPETSVYVGWAPFHHVMGLMSQVFMPAYHGTQTVVMSTAQFQRRPVLWLQLMSKHRATWTAAGNFAFDLCAQLATDEQVAELDLSRVQTFFTGSEPVRMETVHRFVDRFASAGVHLDQITPAYGATEAMLITAKQVGGRLFYMDVDADALELGTLRGATTGRAYEMVSCGVPFPGSSVVVVDPATGLPVEEGQVGEVWTASASVSAGYWNNPKATAEVFGAKLPGDDRDYMRTGDLAAFFDGELFITGRVKDLIIIRGRNIYPQDLEAAATRVHPSVGIGAAFELANHPSDVGIVLEFDPERVENDDAGLDALSREIRAALVREFSLPSLAVAFLATGDVPRTASGKVRRSLSRSLIENGELDVLFADGFAKSR
jgi:acyl-CoA synthetase (AMP-forming)/AMP-acid ligase II